MRTVRPPVAKDRANSLDQAGLADPRLAADDHRGSDARLHPRAGRFEARQLGAPSDESPRIDAGDHDAANDTHRAATTRLSAGGENPPHTG